MMWILILKSLEFDRLTEKNETHAKFGTIRKPMKELSFRFSFFQFSSDGTCWIRNPICDGKSSYEQRSYIFAGLLFIHSSSSEGIVKSILIKSINSSNCIQVFACLYSPLMQCRIKNKYLLEKWVNLSSWAKQIKSNNIKLGSSNCP